MTSDVTSSGNDHPIEGRANGDGFVAGVCPECGAKNPPTHIEGIGADAIRCNQCGAPCAPFEFTNGYTIAFDEKKQVGVTLEKEGAQKVAADGRRYM